ncbi:MAG: hypothetical protein EOP06_20625, partial [Proteobacteria bacterium]
MTDFTVPQRQSPIGIIIMFAHTLQSWARAFAPALVIFIVQFRDEKFIFYVFGLVALLLITAVVAWLRYRNFTFWIEEDNEEFLITEGILNKSKTVIQLHKIQQVNITQSLLQRIVGVYALDVDTAGSSKKEGTIRAISHELAIALKARLLVNSGRASIPITAESDSTDHRTETKPFIKISFLSLF